MAKITRKLQKIFGGSLTPTNNIAQFGSLKAGSIAYDDDPDVIQDLSAYDNGWAAAVVNNNAPALQDRNALDYLFSRQIAYIGQAGVAEYSADVTYYTGSLATDGNGIIYRSIDDDNVGNALSDNDYWQCTGLAYIGADPQVGGSTPFQMAQGNNRIQVLNPAGNITVKLPSTGILAGEVVEIYNRSTYNVTIQSQDGDDYDIINNGYIKVAATQATPTDATHWVTLDVKSLVACKSYRTTAQTVSSGSLTQVLFDTELYDYGSFQTVGGSAKATIPRAGIYSVFCVIGWSANPGGPYTMLDVNTGTLQLYFQHITNADARRYSGNIVLQCAKDDILRIYTYQNSGGNLDLKTGEDETAVAITRIG